jgi:hypothetical protein
MSVRRLSCLCIAIPRPKSYVMLRRMGAAMSNSLSEKACTTLAARAGLNSFSLMNMSSLLVRSTRVLIALALAAPWIRSPFPMAWKLPILNLRRAQLDAHNLRVSDLCGLPLLRGTRLWWVWRRAAISSRLSSPTGWALMQV